MTSPPPLKTTSALLSLVPDPPATVAVRNLSTTAPLRRAGRDAWGRSGKPQPCLISASVSFAAPFAAAAARDGLGGGDTVHYGVLSKVVVGSVEGFERGVDDERQTGEGVVEGREGEGGREGKNGERSVRDVLGRVWSDLTGLGLEGEVRERREGQEKALVDVSKVRLLSVTVALPKASLLGDGVSLTASALFEEGTGRMEGRALALEVSRLRVPTLVGLNPNERLAKQFVVTTVTIDGFDRQDDVYTEIEAVVVKALEESSFETLEALGAHLAERVLTTRLHQDSWLVCIRMEKPTAVPMADCPIVEVRATRASLEQMNAAAGPSS